MQLYLKAYFVKSERIPENDAEQREVAVDGGAEIRVESYFAEFFDRAVKAERPHTFQLALGDGELHVFVQQIVLVKVRVAVQCGPERQQICHCRLVPQLNRQIYARHKVA